jgi:hypothetical protein
VQRNALALEQADVDRGWIVDQRDLALRRNQLGDGVPVVVRLVQRGDVAYRRQAQALDLVIQRFAVVDDVVRAQLLDPLGGVGTRGGADDGQAG